ncbi:non-hydrolyzing UDP-N-acetylglucosamine 2-epimerase [Methanosaeta sp. UBA356]|jgi:UDP-N-acetylglucosamine 2-epimerase (non-hydrolysing)|uniref:non-hydrolyzing UDP-N-acetylglucosamine 2-epimerase n=1 Tax=Methanosaeta sp. UBA356 TaxID=1915559 RepID=UPI00257D1BC4|nr:UDP-N-acetylglucosamine 2-epimerase (non-hydrolyzing) [Methanosaeta sp. UBA356]
MTIAIILGTRPEIIKMAPAIRECQRRGLDYSIIHTGQHYSYQMDRIFFEQLELPQPDHNLDVGSGNHGEQTGRILADLEAVLMAERPDVVLVQGDTNTVMAGALAASKLQIKVGHVEAGLRSYDRSMPEEINRVVADHVSDYCFAPTEISKANLLKEGIAEEKIHVTGNTIVDSVYQNLEIAMRKVNILADLGLEPKGYFLVTSHRQENVDNKERLGEIIRGLGMVKSEFGLPMVFPVHPRTRKMVESFGFELDGIRAIEPLGFLEFLQLEAGARLALTDSGGVQEETCILGVPCVTLRDNTERPETLDVGANVLAGADALRMVDRAKRIMLQGNEWENPFGDGKAGKCIIEHLTAGWR